MSCRCRIFVCLVVFVLPLLLLRFYGSNIVCVTFWHICLIFIVLIFTSLRLAVLDSLFVYLDCLFGDLTTEKSANTIVDWIHMNVFTGSVIKSPC